MGLDGMQTTMPSDRSGEITLRTEIDGKLQIPYCRSFMLQCAGKTWIPCMAIAAEMLKSSQGRALICIDNSYTYGTHIPKGRE